MQHPRAPRRRTSWHRVRRGAVAEMQSEPTRARGRRLARTWRSRRRVHGCAAGRGSKLVCTQQTFFALARRPGHGVYNLARGIEDDSERVEPSSARTTPPAEHSELNGRRTLSLGSSTATTRATPARSRATADGGRTCARHAEANGVCTRGRGGAVARDWRASARAGLALLGRRRGGEPALFLGARKAPRASRSKEDGARVPSSCAGPGGSARHAPLGASPQGAYTPSTSATYPAVQLLEQPMEPAAKATARTRASSARARGESRRACFSNRYLGNRA